MSEIKDWSDVDFSATRSFIPGMFGFRIRINPIPLYYVPVARAPKWYESVDWSKSNKVIVEETGKTYSYVLQCRHRLNPKGSPYFSGPRIPKPNKMLAFWESLDWMLNDIALSIQCGVTRERIRQIRKMLGKPQSPHFHKVINTGESTQRRKQIVDVIKSDLGRFSNMTGVEIAAEVGEEPELVVSLCRLNNIKILDGRFDYDRIPFIDWRLPNRTIEEIWGYTNIAVTRIKKCLGKSYFSRYASKMTPEQTEEFWRAVDDQMEKAKAAGLNPIRPKLTSRCKLPKPA